MSSISEVVNSCDIVSVADRIIGTRTGQSGHNITYDCPRHKSLSRKSFSVNREKQLFFCHGCGVGGDVLSMVEFVRFGACGKKLDSGSRRIALEELAQTAGINLEPVSEEYQKSQAEQNIVFECLTQLKDWWIDNLVNRPDVQAWITEQWGFTSEEQAALELGYAPEDNGKLRDIVDPTIRTGAYIKVGKDKMLPLFQGRVIFPYMQRGICVYAIGRKTPWTPDSKYEDSKYKKMITCSDNHPYVGKCIRNDNLYNYTAIYSNGPIIITEGTADCARLSLAGFSAISPGTTTIPSHTYQKIVKQLSGKEIVILNDNDEAGKAGAVKMAADFAERGIKVKIASFPESESKIDVCSFFQSGGTPEDIERIIKAAKTAGTNKTHDIYRDDEQGNADRFVELAQNIAKYVKDYGWVINNKSQWLRDDKYAIEIYRKLVIPAIYQESDQALISGDEKGAITLAKWAKKSKSAANSNASLGITTTMDGIYYPGVDLLNRNIWLYNCLNGTIDLISGKLRPHDPRDMITKIVRIEYNPEARAPRWETFLFEITNDDTDMINFLQCAVGYSLTGTTREQVCFFAYGLGANGKSVFLNTLLKLAGEYGIQTAPDLLMQSPSGSQKHPTEQAVLHSHRVAVAQECEQGRKMAISTVKQITSSDRIRARFMHKDSFEFAPTHKLWIAANHKPIIHDNTNSIWRRIKMIPFDAVIPESKQDKNLLDKLEAELPGILNWAVKGCLQYQKTGLPRVERIERAIEDYRESSNTVLEFLAEKCICVTADKNMKTHISDLYLEYRFWAETEGETIWSKRAFSSAVLENGFERCRGNGGKWIFRGIKLKSIASQDELAAAKNVLQFPVREREIDFNDSEVEQENERE